MSHQQQQRRRPFFFIFIFFLCSSRVVCPLRGLVTMSRHWWIELDSRKNIFFSLAPFITTVTFSFVKRQLPPKSYPQTYSCPRMATYSHLQIFFGIHIQTPRNIGALGSCKDNLCLPLFSCTQRIKRKSEFSLLTKMSFFKYTVRTYPPSFRLSLCLCVCGWVSLSVSVCR